MRLEYFQMLDRVVSLSIKDGVIHTSSTVPDQSPVFEGHFPGHPIMPGVLLIEAMAQSCGMMTLATINFSGLPLLAGVRDAKLRSFVRPGAVLEIEGRMLHEGSGFTKAVARGSVAGSQVCSAELTYRILPFPAPALREQMMQAAREMHLPMEALADGQ